MKYAEKSPYWVTTVNPYKSQAEIMVLLEDFGATNSMVAQGQADGKLAWLVRFEYEGVAHRFAFTPLECEYPDKVSSFGGTRRKHSDQARFQMGRTAAHFTKAILTAAESQPHALFGFVELPEAGYHAGGIPVTAGELNIDGLVGQLPELSFGDIGSRQVLLQAETPDIRVEYVGEVVQ